VTSAREVRYGTAGWSFADWYGPFYPRPPVDDGPGALFTGVPARPPDPDVGLARRRPLAYYARYFDAVEVGSSAYRIPSPRTTARWCDLTERRAGRPFLFSFKLPLLFTHEGDLQPTDVRALRAALEPVRERGRLGALLAQFPLGFSFTRPARERVGWIRDAFAGLPLVVEVRHRSWEADAARDLLRGLGVTLAAIDQPQCHKTLRPSTALTTPALAYVRLHGRNAAAWFDPGAGRDRRSDYLYGPAEVREWGARIDRLAARAERTVVIATNHLRGQAPANALELRRLREPAAVRVPGALSRAYPRLVS